MSSQRTQCYGGQEGDPAVVRQAQRLFFRQLPIMDYKNGYSDGEYQVEHHDDTKYAL